MQLSPVTPRDYTPELAALVALKDVHFQAHHTEIWILSFTA